MSLEQLNDEFDYMPEKQVQEFEALVRRDAPAWDGSTDRPMTKEQLSRCWRRFAMIGTHQQVIRISEALIDVYMDARQGKQTHALGQVGPNCLAALCRLTVNAVRRYHVAWVSV